MNTVNINLTTIFAKEIEMKFNKIELISEHCGELKDQMQKECSEGIKRCHNIIKIMGDEKERLDRIEKQNKET